MTLLSLEELKSLAEQPKGFSVSIYMPIQKAGPEVRQNEIRFKNLMKTAERKLVDVGMTETEAGDFFQPLLEDFDQQGDFWEQQQHEGLAIFLTEDSQHYYSVARSFNELVVVTDQFHLKPLLQVVTNDSQFYVLELSQKDVKLFVGDHYSIQKVEVSDLPQSVDEALNYDETAQEEQSSTATSKGGTSSTAQHLGAPHGQGSPDRDDIKQDLRQFFSLIDAALHNLLREKRAPLILACVDYLMPVYRQVNTYPHLLEEGITGNIKAEKLEEIHQEAWTIVEPYLMQSQQAAIDHFRDLSGTDKISTNLTETVSAAYYGRVEQLFVAVGVQRWGTFDPTSNEIHVHSEAQPGDEDLLDAAAIQTLLNGGKVYAVEPDQVPDQAPLAAVFRY